MSRRKNADIGKNRYGLDMSYFRNLFDRELNKPLADFTPKELARVLARASRTADPDVMHEQEFLQGMEIVPVERLKYLNDHHHATESGVGLARLALSRGDTQRAIEALNSTSEKLDSILGMLAATKEKGE